MLKALSNFENVRVTNTQELQMKKAADKTTITEPIYVKLKRSVPSSTESGFTRLSILLANRWRQAFNAEKFATRVSFLAHLEEHA